MTQAELTLVDLRPQVRAALVGISSTVPFQVRERWNRQTAEGAVITYAQTDNRSTSCPVVDELRCQIDVFAPERAEATELSEGVNQALLALGLRREEMRESVEENGLRRCTLVYGRRVDKRFLRFID